MKKRYNLLILLLICGKCYSQNLVPNPSFENYSSCPTNISQLANAIPWQSTTWGTPDYFNQCDVSATVGVPYNNFGFQYPRTGVAYVGFWTRNGPPNSNYREYLTAPLLDTLQAGVRYYVTIHINISCYTPTCNQAGTDGFGIYLSTGNPDTTGVYQDVISINPQVENPAGNIIIDSVNWVPITGSFIATGGENYITIGNFRNDSNTTGLSGYYFMDDVCLSTDSLLCNTFVSSNEIKAELILDLYPNPFYNELNISLKSYETCEVTLFDSMSRILLHQKFTNSIRLNTDQLAKGIYLYELRNKNGVIKKGIIMKG